MTKSTMATGSKSEHPVNEVWFSTESEIQPAMPALRPQRAPIIEDGLKGGILLEATRNMGRSWAGNCRNTGGRCPKEAASHRYGVKIQAFKGTENLE